MTYASKTLELLRLFLAAASLSPFTAHLMAQTTPVPAALEVPPGNEEYLRAGAKGTQNYLCMPSGWVFIGPQATLTVKLGKIRHPVATHFLSPNPDETGTPRATWQSSFDASVVWANAIAASSDYAQAGAVPWLLLQAAGAEKGFARGSALSDATYIQRLNTAGGTAPISACVTGTRAFVPYTAEYVFFRKADR